MGKFNGRERRRARSRCPPARQPPSIYLSGRSFNLNIEFLDKRPNNWTAHANSLSHSMDLMSDGAARGGGAGQFELIRLAVVFEQSKARRSEWSRASS
jgi:hypothetical protein